jgi:hypothetical protein
VSIFTFFNWLKYCGGAFVVSLFLAVGIVEWIAVDYGLLHAQDFPVCDFATVDQLLAISSEAIDNGDDAVTWDALNDLLWEIRSTRALCNGLAFASDTEGMETVFSLELEAGNWVATATTEGAISVHLLSTDGNCRDDLLFNEFPEEATNGIRRVVQSEGCAFLVEVSNTREAWVLTFEKVT